jgi:hypothetical protein
MDRVKICRDACLNVSRNDETLCSYTRCVSTHINTFKYMHLHCASTNVDTICSDVLLRAKKHRCAFRTVFTSVSTYVETLCLSV